MCAGTPRSLWLVVRVLLVLLAVVALGAGLALLPAGASAATCSEYSTQAEAQRAGDTRDPDGDGILCESLPCPCATGGGSGGGADRAPAARPKASCSRPRDVQRIVFSRRRYPNIRRHYVAAVGRGWPRILVINRRGTEARRDRLLEDVPTRAGHDRDEYPPAVGRGRGRKVLKRGANPVGWMADVMYVRSAENRSHGSKLGAALRPFCDGTRFRYIFK